LIALELKRHQYAKKRKKKTAFDTTTVEEILAFLLLSKCTIFSWNINIYTYCKEVIDNKVSIEK
jgi:hypothetical protein